MLLPSATKLVAALVYAGCCCLWRSWRLQAAVDGCRQPSELTLILQVYRGVLEMQECVVAGNTAFGGAGLNLYFSARVVLEACNVSDNEATGGSGGGLFNWDTTLTLRATRIAHNRASAHGNP